MENIKLIKAELDRHINVKRQKEAARFFKTGPGEYAEGDQFLGVSNPDLHKISKLFWDVLAAEEVAKLLKDPIHEVRLLGVFILVKKFQKAKTEVEKEVWVNVYLNNLEKINNWDLVDSSAYQILGAWLYNKPRIILVDFAKSGELWKQRIAMIATLFFIKKDEFEDTFLIAEILLHHKHDLIHKAVGWMLREIGKRDLDILEEFLHRHIQRLARTSLRYAIEPLPPFRRQYYLALR